MEIISVRIDERLIHAQVTINWINELRPDRVVIVDDNILADDTQKTALKLSCPKDSKLSILETKNFASRINEGFFQEERILVLCKGIKAIRRMEAYGCGPFEVAIGNLHYLDEDSIVINENVSISPEQKQQLLELHTKGFNFYAQLFPNDEKLAIIPLLDK
ncbi:MAG: PTS sugar transporter subunit IIB [Erysipelotrichaceae bacterium]|nr:PTS sugar transporter subunit IIB [Erysipelotrichaceae bacterium]MDY5251697.1 PTS sugar transporter subunit IIB [Erysipelotrichaceae bacterium]